MSEVKHLYEGTLTDPFQRHAEDCQGCEIERLREALRRISAACNEHNGIENPDSFVSEIDGCVREALR